MEEPGTEQREARVQEVDPSLGVYGITTAALLTGLSPQTLRLYEARGIVAPSRTAGGTRRYSADDIRRLDRVAGMLVDGLNLAGVGAMLELQDRNTELQAENDVLRAQQRSTGATRKSRS